MIAGSIIADFNSAALTLFSFQFDHVEIYRQFCEHLGVTPATIQDWRDIPALPTAAFKEHAVTSLSEAERTHVFHSSGTTQQTPSRHFHNEQSLSIYEVSMEIWFNRYFPANARLIVLTPPPAIAPHSSLVHMFDTIRRAAGAPESVFMAGAGADGAWVLDFEKTLHSLSGNNRPVTVMGTAFSFVHLFDELETKHPHPLLPSGSCALETGGYKGRSRTLPKVELHCLITKYLGIQETGIVAEYGMSELSSQAYEREGVFHFPPWARTRIISPETGLEVEEGQIGLLQVFDLANTYSVMSVQTEDLAIRRGEGFELLGRAALAEPRGCSLMPE